MSVNQPYIKSFPSPSVSSHDITYKKRGGKLIASIANKNVDDIDVKGTLLIETISSLKRQITELNTQLANATQRISVLENK
jgi:hypothetical protein